MGESLKLKNRSIPLSDTHVERLEASADRESQGRGSKITWTERARDLIINGLAREEREEAEAQVA